MKNLKAAFFLSLSLIALAITACSGPSEPEKSANIELRGVTYFPRWSEKTQHEFTPQGQEDLEHWADMVTLVDYPDVKDPGGLAGIANAVLGLYKENGAIVVATDSIAKGEGKPGEHLIVVYFPQDNFIEAVFARFILVDSAGLGVIYSHRIYGKDHREQMNTWFEANGQATEDAVKALENFPVTAKNKAP